MKQAILNFLATRAGAYLSPVISAGLSAGFAWLSTHIPVVGPYLATPEAQTAIVGLAFGLIMTVINWLTTTRGFKYVLQVQATLNTLGRPYGIKMDEDGVAGPVTAEKTALVADSVKAGPPAAEDMPHVSPAAAIVSNPGRKG